MGVGEYVQLGFAATVALYLLHNFVRDKRRGERKCEADIKEHKARIETLETRQDTLDTYIRERLEKLVGECTEVLKDVRELFKGSSK